MAAGNEVFKLCESYGRVAGIPTYVIDDTGRPLGPKCYDGFPHPFCQFIQETCCQEEECRRAHLYGVYQAERFGEAYTFFCPFGLVHWVAPILEGNQVVSSLVSGPVLMSTPEDALVEEILSRKGLTERDVRILRGRLEGIPFVSPERVRDLASMMFAIASHLSGSDGAELLDARQKFARQQASIGTILQDWKGEAELPSYPLDKEKELLSLIRLGDKPGAQRVLNEILGFIFFAEGNDVSSIKTRVVELVVLLSRAALEGGAEDEFVFGLNYRYLGEIEGLNTVDEIAFWLSRVMTRFTECVFNLTGVKNIDVIYKAISYLRQNYMKNVTLESAASEVGLSPSYFSKVFREEIKVNFRTYLNELRIEQSKRLLAEESIPLVEVAGLVGFQDQSYFSRVFRRITGMSPGEFRRTRGCKTSGGM